MRDKHLREIVEILGVISIVAALMLVAWEIREANRIATAEIEMRLARDFDQLNLRRAMAPDFAKLYPKLSAPENHLVTATEESQIQGIAAHLAGTYSAVQVAHDNGLLDAQDLESYRRQLARTLERFPGLVPALRRIHDETPEMSAAPVFQPLRVAEPRRVPRATEAPSPPD